MFDESVQYQRSPCLPETTLGALSLAHIPQVGTCANPRCTAKFRRLGEGRISVISTDDPEAWGLPEHIKQKVVWLCDECSSLLDIRVDHGSCLVHLIEKPRNWAA